MKIMKIELDGLNCEIGLEGIKVDDEIETEVFDVEPVEVESWNEVDAGPPFVLVRETDEPVVGLAEVEGTTLNVAGFVCVLIGLAVDEAAVVKMAGFAVDATVAEALVGWLTILVITGIGASVVEILIMYLFANAPSLLPQ